MPAGFAKDKVPYLDKLDGIDQAEPNRLRNSLRSVRDIQNLSNSG